MKLLGSIVVASVLLVGCAGDEHGAQEPVTTTDDMGMTPPSEPMETPDAPGMMDDGGIDSMAEAASEATGMGTWSVSAHSLRVRSNPSMDGDVLRHVQKGTEVTAYEEKSGWVRISEDSEWVAKRWLAQ